MEERLKKIVEEWYLCEPALFMAYCTHSIRENRSMGTAMRSGQRVIEFNPDLMRHWDNHTISERLKLEVIRILLGHPYQRQPHNAIPAALGLSSDITLNTLYPSSRLLPVPADLKVPQKLCFEEYYRIVLKYIHEKADSQDKGLKGPASDSYVCQGTEMKRILCNSAETATLWEEDQMMQENIRAMVERLSKNAQWGSLPGNVYEEIIASNIVHIDYRTILSMFRRSVLSSKRQLTRMRPSRRYGFEQMGSKRGLATRLLVAADVSCSVESDNLSQALSIINRFFKYGIESIDVVQFDTGITGEKLSLKKAISGKFTICGRGGTCFQEPVDMLSRENYDGLIIITDGFAPRPSLPPHTSGKILWMIYASSADCRTGELPPSIDWISGYPQSRYLILPPRKGQRMHND